MIFKNIFAVIFTAFFVLSGNQVGYTQFTEDGKIDSRPKCDICTASIGGSQSWRFQNNENPFQLKCDGINAHYFSSNNDYWKEDSEEGRLIQNYIVENSRCTDSYRERTEKEKLLEKELGRNPFTLVLNEDDPKTADLNGSKM